MMIDRCFMTLFDPSKVVMWLYRGQWIYCQLILVRSIVVEYNSSMIFNTHDIMRCPTLYRYQWYVLISLCMTSLAPRRILEGPIIKYLCQNSGFYTTHRLLAIITFHRSVTMHIYDWFSNFKAFHHKFLGSFKSRSFINPWKLLYRFTEFKTMLLRKQLYTR